MTLGSCMNIINATIINVLQLSPYRMAKQTIQPKKRYGTKVSTSFFMAVILTFITGIFSMTAQASEHLITVPSNYSVTETADRFEQALQQKGIQLFARIDHAKNAEQVDLSLRPSQVLIFGNPNVGTKLMQCKQSVAIDLPLKVHVYQDEASKVWLSYYSPANLQKRHKIDACDELIFNIGNALHVLATTAVSAELPKSNKN